MWNNLQVLISLANIIQWISIIMIFIGGLLQVGKFFVDNRVTNLNNIDIIQKDSIRAKTETKLNIQVDSLKIDLERSKNEITELTKKTKYVDPYTQPIQSGTATVTIKIRTNENFNSNYMDRGGYIAFGKGNEEILVLNNNQCVGKSTSKDVAVFQGIFHLNASHKNIGKELTFLKETQFIQIQFMPLTKNYQIIEGTAVCVFNGNARIEFSIPKQLMVNNQIFIRDLKKELNEKFK